jgi:hypothetical protein
VETQEERLRRLVAGVERSGLRVPVAILLDALSPLDVISSQLARFSLPLVGGTGAEPYAAALSEAAAWRELRRLLDAPPPGERPEGS